MLVQQDNTFGDLFSYLLYSTWTQVCYPLVGVYAFLNALLFGDYVGCFYMGLDFCQKSFLADVQIAPAPAV